MKWLEDNSKHYTINLVSISATRMWWTGKEDIDLDKNEVQKGY